MATASASTWVGGDEIGGLVGVGEQLRAVERAGGAVPVFLLAMAAFQRAEAAQLAFHRHADGVRQLRHFAGHGDVVLVARRRLAVDSPASRPS